jgi:hypothetical protein
LPESPGKTKHGAHFAVPSSSSSFAYPNYPPLSLLSSLYISVFSFGGKGGREGGRTSSMDELLSMDVLVASGCNGQTLGIRPFIIGGRAGYYIFSQKSILKIKIAKMKCFLRFLIAIIWPKLKENKYPYF